MFLLCDFDRCCMFPHYYSMRDIMMFKRAFMRYRLLQKEAFEPQANLFGGFFRCPNETKFESTKTLMCSLFDSKEALPN